MHKLRENSLFQKYCQKAIENITEEDIDNFRKVKDDESRIKIMYKYAKNIPILPVNNGKDLKAAENEKMKGNGFFAKKDNVNALNSYNMGIIKCPQDTDNARELLSILISNRSATFFDLKEYKKVLNDIDYVFEIGTYPQHLHYKIWLRKAKCYEAQQNVRLADEAYSEAIKRLQHAKLDEKQKLEKTKEIEEGRNKECFGVNSHLVPFTGEDFFIGSKDYISAHKNISFEQDQYQGRYARAAEDFEAGVVIVEETPYCSVVASESSLTNCQYCLISTRQFFACPNCANVVFCSSNCERLANRSFHKYECCFQPVLFDSGASINCSMALRIITQSSLNFFLDKRKILKDFMKDSCKKVALKRKPYRPDDYINVFFLCRNEHLRKPEELIHYSCMAIYLLRLLQTTNFFLKETDKNVYEELGNNESFICSLILRHLQILQFNAHEISELRNATDGDPNDDETLYKSEYIGGGLYPTVALFNHSCDPSIVRYNVGNKIIVRTVKPIKNGEIIYENYGPLYTTMNKSYRQQFLSDRYWFECLCPPCVDLWPLLENMREEELRIPCKTEKCPFVFIIHRDDCMPFLTCKFCKQTTTLIPFLKGLMSLQQILADAEDFYCKSQFESASKKYVEALHVLFVYTKPPCPDIVKIQQRLRTCLIHFGNKSVDYQMVYNK